MRKFMFMMMAVGMMMFTACGSTGKQEQVETTVEQEVVAEPEVIEVEPAVEVQEVEVTTVQ
jgi:hypothetical protein